MKDPRSYLSIKKDAAYRAMLWHSKWGHKNNLYVSEFPRSGGTWLSQMLAELTQLPFPRNQNLEQQPCILHGHHLSSDHPGRTIHMLRDGRDVVISAYHYFLLNNEISSVLQSKWRNTFSSNYMDIRSNLPKFIEVLFSEYRIGFRYLNWASFVNKYNDQPGVYTVKYENLSTCPVETLRGVLRWIDIHKTDDELQKIVVKYHFKNQSGREPGTEDQSTFLRKGIIGDWHNYFSKVSADVFNHYAGDALIAAGYVSQKNWYNEA